MEHDQQSSILKELSDIKSSLAVNTAETQNIKANIGEIKSDVREIKTNSVTQEQHTALVTSIADHETRIRSNETLITRIMTVGSVALVLLGIMEYVLNHYWK